jgi:hypothetical protein
MRLLTVLLTFAAASLPTMTSFGQEPQPPTPAAPVASTPQGAPATTAMAPARYAPPVRFTPEPPKKYSAPMMGIGVGVTALGIIGTMVGSVLVGYGAACPNQDRDCLTEQRLGYGLGTIFLTAGSVVAGAGIPLWVVGTHDEPAIGWALPSVRVGVTSAELQWAF